MKDKIIQITTAEGENGGATFGLGESGTLYLMVSDYKRNEKSEIVYSKEGYTEYSGHIWKKITASPDTERKPDICSICKTEIADSVYNHGYTHRKKD